MSIDLINQVFLFEFLLMQQAAEGSWSSWSRNGEDTRDGTKAEPSEDRTVVQNNKEFLVVGGLLVALVCERNTGRRIRWSCTTRVDERYMNGTRSVIGLG